MWQNVRRRTDQYKQRAIELSGGSNVLVRETKCRSRGDEVREYHCSWE
jgi:hypothetical protein